ncbi:hypothetical protein NW731_04870 [Mycoplasmopsis felis]|nr:hypothetical protein [Mycoplasmopsis felis]MCU9937743.1 hypothetical protein [Mycoplasmopsis felis]
MLYDFAFNKKFLIFSDTESLLISVFNNSLYKLFLISQIFNNSSVDNFNSGFFNFIISFKVSNLGIPRSFSLSASV